MAKQKVKKMDSEKIKKKAKDVLLNSGLPTDRPIDVTLLAQKQGYKVYEVLFDDKDIAGMTVDSDKEKSIYVSKQDNEGRKRFTIAHELAHAILHHKKLKKEKRIVDYRKPLTDYENSAELRREIQANMFAAELLMPEHLTRKFWDFKKDVDEMANFFTVSPKAAVVRLESLSLI
ncbi:MAG: ImmA/IrrE family metallo-endopeptidase [Candidatus Moranbacteria bacterium]|nr:ImmA/IrrE family metallo-endopeptidase [Candidatus Moranbacteria bacterium]